MQLFVCQAQNKKKVKLWPAKEDMTAIVDSLKARADSLDRLVVMKDSIIQSLYKIPDTVTVNIYGKDSLIIAQQQDSICLLNQRLFEKDSLVSKLAQNLCFADSIMVRYAYGLCYEEFDRANIEEAEQIISRLYQSELKAEMDKELLVLLKNYEAHYNTLLGILTMAQNDSIRESSVFVDDFKTKYINKIKEMTYYKKHYKQLWSIVYLDELIDELIKVLESHTRETKADFSKYIN
jgi:hypothetical protein